MRSNPVDLSTNLDVLSAEKATHHLLTFTRKMAGGYRGKVQIYDKEIDRLILPKDEDNYEPENSGQGHAYGLELIPEKEATPSGCLSGLITYAYGKAEYRHFNSREWFRFKYDRRHSFTLLANVRLSDSWNTSLLGQVSSGLPYTDVLGLQSRILADNSTAVHGFIKGKRNAASLPVYGRLDFRINYRSSLAAGLSFYLDLINVLNRKNIYEISWEKRRLTTGHQKITRREIYSLPRIITVGLRFRL
jgi:hypothetical protein